MLITFTTGGSSSSSSAVRLWCIAEWSLRKLNHLSSKSWSWSTPICCTDPVLTYASIKVYICISLEQVLSLLYWLIRHIQKPWIPLLNCFGVGSTVACTRPIPTRNCWWIDEPVCWIASGGCPEPNCWVALLPVVCWIAPGGRPEPDCWVALLPAVCWIVPGGRPEPDCWVALLPVVCWIVPGALDQKSDFWHAGTLQDSTKFSTCFIHFHEIWCYPRALLETCRKCWESSCIGKQNMYIWQ